MIDIASVDSGLGLRDAVRLRPKLLRVQRPSALGFGQIGEIWVHLDRGLTMPHVAAERCVTLLLETTWRGPEPILRSMAAKKNAVSGSL